MMKLFLCLAPAFAGCGWLQQQAEPKDPVTGNAMVMTYPATVRGAYFKKGDKPFVCAEPVPDVAAGEALKAAAKIVAEAASASADGSTLSGKGQIEGSGEHSVSVTALDGRSELVLVVRESLYRVCEATYNRDYSEQNSKDLYVAALGGITQLANALKSEDEAKKAAAEKGKAEQEAKKAEAEKEKAKAELERAQTEVLNNATAGLTGGDKALALLLTKACLSENTACMEKEKDKNICTEKFKTCVSEKLKLVK